MICFPQAASAAQAEIGWNAVSGQVAGYNVLYGTESGNYTSTQNVGNNTTATLQNLALQTYFMVVSAYDSSNNQSPLSAELVVDSLSASAGSGGSISPSGSFFKARGASQTFTITPATGYVISKVQVDGTSVGAVASYTLSNISATHSISATFSASNGTGTGKGTGTGGSSSYTVSASPGPNGTVSPSGSVSVNSGSSQTFTLTPTPGYSIASVLVDGASVGAVSSYTFSDVMANHTISATFALTTQSHYSITATAGSNGSLSPTGAVSVRGRANQIFAITPAAGYRVSSVLVDGTSIGSETAYTFYKVSANHTISASFAAATAPPIADAGPKQTVKDKSVTVTLSGANSTDVGGPGIASYQWAQTGGPQVTLSAPHSVTTTFGIPASHGALTFQLTVTDKNGLKSTSTCIVNASTSYTTAPKANAGHDQTVGAGSAVALNATASTGAPTVSADAIKTYLWQQLDGPSVTLSNTASLTPIFTAPQGKNGYASLCFMLTVTDSLGLKSADFCFVNVSPTGSASSAPKAVAGSQRTVNAGKTVKLKGTASKASSGIASYRWRQAGGTPVKLSDPTSATPSFTAAKYSGTNNNKVPFTLIVTDKNGLRAKATELVTVR
ncbi:MAG: hypothetical protein P4L55_13300 [Syntrophobacteraceae bacterium]|nr:hypothetical protein [Syntrophobacteraceae bacterium]